MLLYLGRGGISMGSRPRKGEKRHFLSKNYEYRKKTTEIRRVEYGLRVWWAGRKRGE